MTALQRFVVVLLVTVVSLMTARAAEASCGSDDDCKGDRICRDGTCQTVATPAATRCTVDVDCAGDDICEDGQCRAADAAAGTDPETADSTGETVTAPGDDTPEANVQSAPPVASPPPPQPVAVVVAPTTGAVRVTSEVPGTVLIDGGAVGRAPIEVPGLIPGGHEVRVDFDSGGNRKLRVTVVAGSVSDVHVEMTIARQKFSYRDGVSFGAEAGLLVPYIIGEVAGVTGDAGAVMNYGIVPAVDLRLGAWLAAGAVGGEAWLAPRGGAQIRFNLGSVYSIIVGASGGAAIQPELDYSAWFVSPEFSFTSFRFGEKRQFELTLMGHWFLSTSDLAEDENNLALAGSGRFTYLFL